MPAWTLAQAFAYYDFDETSTRLVYDSTAVNRSTSTTTRRSATVSWRRRPLAQPLAPGQNALLGWNPALPGQGNGAEVLGEELAGTKAFAHCQVKKVKAVCLRDLDATEIRSTR